MRRLLVIQEHNALKAGKHWDIRFEARGDTFAYDTKRPETNEPRGTTEKVLRSFVIPKCRFPKKREYILAIQTEDHPWKYKDFEGEIEQGYGKGHVRLVYNDDITVYKFKNEKITFHYGGVDYVLFKTKKNWLMTRK